MQHAATAEGDARPPCGCAARWSASAAILICMRSGVRRCKRRKRPASAGPMLPSCRLRAQLPPHPPPRAFECMISEGSRGAAAEAEFARRGRRARQARLKGETWSKDSAVTNPLTSPPPASRDARQAGQDPVASIAPTAWRREEALERSYGDNADTFPRIGSCPPAPPLAQPCPFPARQTGQRSADVGAAGVCGCCVPPAHLR